MQKHHVGKRVAPPVFPSLQTASKDNLLLLLLLLLSPNWERKSAHKKGLLYSDSLCGKKSPVRAQIDWVKEVRFTKISNLIFFPRLDKVGEIINKKKVFVLGPDLNPSLHLYLPSILAIGRRHVGLKGTLSSRDNEQSRASTTTAFHKLKFLLDAQL